ncbi:MAG: amidohydrolase 2 [Puniceicoccaceae bacterium 5H]|nr:MAG: amidohydrolase 2 [Puniceicoccaceae bacterium 5H]
MTGIIDWHTHRYPEELAADPNRWAAEHDEHHWAELVTNGPQGWAGRGKMLADMQAAGVAKCVLQGWYWTRQETCHWHNQQHLEWAREDPEHFIPMAIVQPRAGEEAFEQLIWAVDQGCRGIGEIMPTVQGFDMRTDPTWLKICEYAQERHLPITLHVTEPVGHDYPGRVDTPLMDYVWLAQTFPQLPIVLAHWGGGLPFFLLHRQLRKNFKNIYFDTAASPLLYDAKVWQTVMALVGPERILFGSDYPLRIYPRYDKEASFTRLVEEVKAEVSNREELAQIVTGNAKRLLAL